MKAGFVAILGRPNAGKSTLLNALLGQKLSIVSPKPQTTRHKILGIRNAEDHQICFMDTPGLLRDPKDLLQKSLRHAVHSAARDDADLALLVAEPHVPSEDDLRELATLPARGVPVIVVINKSDLTGKHDAALEAYSKVLNPVAGHKVSALKKDGVQGLLADIVARLPEGEPFYEGGQLSDRYERFFAAEVIREQVFELFEQELPHAIAVVIERFTEKPGRPDEVAATLYVERDGQKGMVLGAKGLMLRKLTARSQAGIENLTGRRTQLEIWVKVRPNWRKDERSLREFGY